MINEHITIIIIITTNCDWLPWMQGIKIKLQYIINVEIGYTKHVASIKFIFRILHYSIMQLRKHTSKQ